jgi:lysozyme
MDVLQLQNPSSEKTSSVSRPDTIVPAADVGYAPPASIPSEGDVIAEFDGPAPREESVQALAMAVPSRPTRRPEAKAVAEPAVGTRVMRQRFRDAKPINFGKVSPGDHAVHGVDVSRWQGDIDWTALRAKGANFAFIKATDGGDHLDPMFKKNWREAKKAGIRRGAYHFFYWCRVASDQADWFIRNVPREEGALPPVLDVEWNGQSRCKQTLSPAKVREKMRVFIERMERHYGQKPIIYTAPDFYRDNLRGHFEGYPFWLRAVAQHPSKVYPGRDWVFWQYSGTGLSKGVVGQIDLNVFHGSEREWQRWVARNAYGARTQ